METKYIEVEKYICKLTNTERNAIGIKEIMMAIHELCFRNKIEFFSVDMIGRFIINETYHDYQFKFDKTLRDQPEAINILHELFKKYDN